MIEFSSLQAFVVQTLVLVLKLLVKKIGYSQLLEELEVGFELPGWDGEKSGRRQGGEGRRMRREEEAAKGGDEPQVHGQEKQPVSGVHHCRGSPSRLGVTPVIVKAK